MFGRFAPSGNFINLWAIYYIWVKHNIWYFCNFKEPAIL